MVSDTPSPELEYTKGVFKLKFLTEGVLYEWTGSTFRGALGRSIKGVVCQNLGEEDCARCNRKNDCLYYFLYERLKSLRGHAPPPRPVMLIPPILAKKDERIIKKNTEISVGFLTIGRFTRYIPHLILALQTMGRFGVGDARHLGRNKFEVVEGRVVWEKEPFFKYDHINLSYFTQRNLQEIKPIEWDKIKIKFITPFGGKQFPLTMERYLFYTKLRLARYVNEYGNGGWVPGDAAKWKKIVGKPDRIRRKIFKRKSSRSDKDRFVAYTGEIDFDINELGLDERWLLAASEIFGLGPNSSFGMGFVEIKER